MGEYQSKYTGRPDARHWLRRVCVGLKFMHVRDMLDTVIFRHDLMYSHSDAISHIVKRMRHLKPAYEFRERYCYTNIVRLHCFPLYCSL